MSWTTLQPATRPKSVTGDAIVTISVSKSSRFTQRVFVTVKARLLPEGKLRWWTYSRPVNVELGAGEHEGRLRLTDQGQFRIMAPTGRKAKDGPTSPILQIAGVPGMPAEGLGRRTVAWEIAGDALIVTLPWSDAKGMAKLAEPAPRMVGAPSAALPAPAPPKKPALPSVVAAQAEIERWAALHDVDFASHGFDLDRVNALRIERGERPWTIRKPSLHGGAA